MQVVIPYNRSSPRPHLQQIGQTSPKRKYQDKFSPRAVLPTKTPQWSGLGWESQRKGHRASTLLCSAEHSKHSSEQH